MKNQKDFSNGSTETAIKEFIKFQKFKSNVTCENNLRYFTMQGLKNFSSLESKNMFDVEYFIILMKK